MWQALAALDEKEEGVGGGARLRIVDKKGFLVGLLFLSVGTGFAVAATGYRLGTPQAMGPGFFPFLVGAAMAVVGLAELGKAVSALAEPKELGSWDLRRLLIVMAAVVSFGLLIEVAGLIAALPALVVIASFASPGFRLRTIVLLGLFLLLLSWVVFIEILSLQISFLPPSTG